MPPDAAWGGIRRLPPPVGAERAALLAARRRAARLVAQDLSAPTPAADAAALADLASQADDLQELRDADGPPLDADLFLTPLEDPDSPLCPAPIGMFNRLSLNLCFGSAALQLLLSSHLFVAALHKMLAPTYVAHDPPNALDILLAFLHRSLEGGATHFNLAEYDNRYLSTGVQQDASEFLAHVLDELVELEDFQFTQASFKRVPKKGAKKAGGPPPAENTSIFKRLYQGSLVSTLPNNKLYTEPFNVLMLHGQATSVEGLIDATLNGDSRLDSVPPVLFLQVMRTEFDSASGFMGKSNRYIEIEDALRLSPAWMTEALSRKWTDELRRQHEYVLKGVICHYGTVNDGHYTAFVKRGDVWYGCDDMVITTSVSHKERQEWSRSASLLLYEQQNVQVVNPLTNVLVGDEEVPAVFRISR